MGHTALRWIGSVAPVLGLVALAGCTGPTPYQARSPFQGGYADTALADGRYRVEFQGNGYTSLEAAYDHAYRRAQELCEADGAKRAAVVDADQEMIEFGGHRQPEVVMTIRCDD